MRKTIAISIIVVFVLSFSIALYIAGGWIAVVFTVGTLVICSLVAWALGVIVND